MVQVSKVSLFTLIARLILAGVFVQAALPKIQDPVAFATSVAAFRVVGPELSGWIALCLPWLELVLGIGILLPAIRRSSAALIGLLLLLFIALHTSAWLRGLDISCGCFGSATGETATEYRWLILRNALLLVASILVLRQDSKE